MLLEGLKIGFALTGSFCTLEIVIPELTRLVARGAEVLPIVSSEVATTDTRFGPASFWQSQLKAITGREPISTIEEAEPIGPQGLIDVLVIAPCTGNTLAKLANGITDSPVLMAAKANLRNQRPVVLAISTNDGLGMNAKNIGSLLNARNIYFVPFGQDQPLLKPNSLSAKFDLILETILAALQGRQLQPLVVGSEVLARPV